MTTPHRDWKQVQRALQSIPVDGIGPRVVAEERDGLWCIVAGGLQFVPADGGTCETSWDEMLEYAQFERWVRARPERVHATEAGARRFVRNHLGMPELP